MFGMTSKLASSITGGLSNTDKMPSKSWNISAKKCKVGSIIARMPNSICHDCYALEGRYMFPVVQNALDKRLTAVTGIYWTWSMATLISRIKIPFFRWFDSGDLQDLAMLQSIVDVCQLTPDIHHWLPTKEYGIVKSYLTQFGPFPDNLVVRVSAIMVNGPAPRLMGLPTSTVVTEGWNCPASEQGNKCLSCRACWNIQQQNVSYKFH